MTKEPKCSECAYRGSSLYSNLPVCYHPHLKKKNGKGTILPVAWAQCQGEFFDKPKGILEQLGFVRESV